MNRQHFFSDAQNATIHIGNTAKSPLLILRVMKGNVFGFSWAFSSSFRLKGLIAKSLHFCFQTLSGGF